MNEQEKKWTICSLNYMDRGFAGGANVQESVW